MKEKDDFLSKFGLIKFGEENSSWLKDFERALNNFLKDERKPQYHSEYMSQEKSKNPYEAEWEKSFKDYFY